MKNKNKDIIEITDNYKYGFRDDVKAIFDAGKGLNEDVIKQISAMKNEPEWMLEYRLKSYHPIFKFNNPNWGYNLDKIDFDDLTYYILNQIIKSPRSWDDVPEKIKNTFEKSKYLNLNVILAQYTTNESRSCLSQYDWRSWRKGVIFMIPIQL